MPISEGERAPLKEVVASFRFPRSGDEVRNNINNKIKDSFVYWKTEIHCTIIMINGNEQKNQHSFLLLSMLKNMSFILLV